MFSKEMIFYNKKSKEEKQAEMNKLNFLLKPQPTSNP